MKDNVLPFTGERYTPETLGNIELEHVHRYLQAREISVDKVVLDIASGEGYGSAMLARRARRVIGVDISLEAIQHAGVRYQKNNLEFVVGSCSHIPLSDSSVDMVVSFETIEHHDQHEQMMQEIKRVLSPTGCLVISSPDKFHYSDELDYRNPFHIKELYEDEFKELIDQHFINSMYFGQRILYGSCLFSETMKLQSLNYRQENNAIRQTLGLSKPVYWIALASDTPLPNLTSSIFEQPIHESDVVKAWSGFVSDRDSQIVNLTKNIEDLDEKIVSLTQTIDDRDAQIACLKQETRDQDGTIRKIEAHYRDLEYVLHALQNSKSWKITAPLRFLFNHLKSTHRRVQKSFVAVAQGIYRSLPLSFETKEKAKNIFFIVVSPLLRDTMVYRNWAAQRARDGVTSEIGTSRDGEMAMHQSEEHVAFRQEPLPANPAVRLIAFYLPQFHPIPENDEWWGKGFTEWTNVSRAVPQFEGHYQPHLPADLGFYDLRLPEIQQQQVELAQVYGLGGFCFYFYWFAGKRLLEKPIRQYLENIDLDFPFCLCWANENWSRRWDGREKEILIAQEHSADDDLAFIEHIAEYFRDSRYIRIDGKPLLIIYRPNLLPQVYETAQRWRKWCREQDIGEIYLAYTQSFETQEPSKYGFDAAIEFPPNNYSQQIITDRVQLVNPHFKGIVYDWKEFVKQSRNYPTPTYPLFRGVCPSWDNEARRSGCGSVFLGSTPSGYQEWLSNACADTKTRFESSDERLVFINAWNEWAEGAHLEPDRRYGFAWLQATRDALVRSSTSMGGRKIVLVAHDAHPHGAQYLTLSLAKTLTSDFAYTVDLILLGSGILAEEFSRWSTVHHLSGLDPRGAEAMELAKKLVLEGHKAAIVNTTVSGFFLETLADAGFRCVALIHELSGVIHSNKLEPQALAISQKADAIVFPASVVAESFQEIAPIEVEKIKIKPQGLYKRNRFQEKVEDARIRLRKELGLEKNDKIVLAVGYADYRKGIDLFVDSGVQVLKSNPHVYFVWLGHWDSTMRANVEQRLVNPSISGHFLFIGHTKDTDLFYAGADVYALTSREDPFPAVALEALEVAVPVVGFKGVGGIEELLENGCGMVVPKEDTTLFAEAICVLLVDHMKAQEFGRKGAWVIQESFSFRQYIFDLLEFSGQPLKRVSVIIPNYNYAHHLEQRLNTVFSQTYPIYEILVLDDASTDNSIEVIERCLSNTCIDNKLIKNEKNSGSVFQQWQKAVEIARGDFVWICEADDVANSTFIERSILKFDDTQVVMSYAQSRQIDEFDNLLCDNYFDYTSDICTDRWKLDYICEGKEEISQALAVKNTIPNVSAVLFKKSNLQESLRRCQKDLLKLKIAGDWLIYSDILQNGRVGYVSEVLNSHRRHQKSVTSSSLTFAHHMAEIIFLQKHISETIYVEESVRAKARKYVKDVYEKFSLGTSGYFSPVEHPEVREALKSISDD